MKTIKALAVIGIILLLFTSLSGCVFTEGDYIFVYHDDSLKGVFENTKFRVEEKHFRLDVWLDSGGSVQNIKKLIEKGEEGHVIAVSDYSLINEYMYPDNASWTVRFGSNRMVLSFSEESEGRERVGFLNWYDILREEDVNFGILDPNNYSLGYQSLFTIKLSEEHYGDEQIFQDLIVNNSDIECSDNQIILPETEYMNNNGKFNIFSNTSNAVTSLSNGDIDYLFTYESTAANNDTIYNIMLPPEIDLGDMEYEDTYQDVSVNLGDGVEIDAKPIQYGLTIPQSVKRNAWPIEFIKMLVDNRGVEVIDENYIDPIDPPVTDDKGAVPEKLRDYVAEGDLDGVQF